jgi:hypothetical protein
MVGIVLANGVADGLDGPALSAGQPAGHVAERAGGEPRHPPGTAKDVLLLRVGHLRELAGPGDLRPLLPHEPPHGTVQERHATLAVGEHHSPRRKRPASPALDRLGRYAELPGQGGRVVDWLGVTVGGQLETVANIDDQLEKVRLE